MRAFSIEIEARCMGSPVMGNTHSAEYNGIRD
jgi:hypothetical protein